MAAKKQVGKAVPAEKPPDAKDRPAEAMLLRGERRAVEQGVQLGRQLRKAVPRSRHATWAPSLGRPDPLTLLRAQDAIRIPDLVPVRWGRMSISPFTFYRGAAALMAYDLASTPVSGLTVQLCGDAHLSNFGVFASPEGRMVFDVNDFDETLPGPWEWDVKRLAASVAIAGRTNGFARAVSRDAALASVRGYREWMTRYAQMGDLAVWYAHVSAESVGARARTKKGTKDAAAYLKNTLTSDSLGTFSKLTIVVNGQLRIIDVPPIIEHLTEAELGLDNPGRREYAAYRASLESDRRTLLSRYEVVDIARKVVGVGSVGTHCFIVLLLGKDDGDPLFLQLKEAGPSVLEAHLPKSRYKNHARRVVAGQRLMQTSSDIFLGWARGHEAHLPVDYYWRQLRDMKSSTRVEDLSRQGLADYGYACGWTLARAHARSGDRVAISAYLGNSDRFDQAIATFSETYADQTERDYERMIRAVKDGTLTVARCLHLRT